MQAHDVVSKHGHRLLWRHLSNRTLLAIFYVVGTALALTCAMGNGTRCITNRDYVSHLELDLKLDCSGRYWNQASHSTTWTSITDWRVCAPLPDWQVDEHIAVWAPIPKAVRPVYPELLREKPGPLVSPLDESTLPNGVVQQVAVHSGWPIRCVDGAYGSGGAGSTPLASRSVFWLTPSVGIPYHLSISGSLLNGAVYAVAIFTIYFLVGLTISALRVRAGLCAACGYPRVREKARCPECGRSHMCI